MPQSARPLPRRCAAARPRHRVRARAQRIRWQGTLALLLALVASTQTPAKSPVSSSSDGVPTIAAKTAAMPRMPGLLPLYRDEAGGKLFLEIPKLNADFLYVESLPYGMGSNDLGLDRGEISEGRIVRFERFGPKVLLVQPNEAFRSASSDRDQQLAVRQSFPESVLAAFAVAAEDKADDANRGQVGAILVDATEFFLRDAHNVAELLSVKHQDPYKLDAARSVLALDATRAFPKNIEVEAILTFTTDSPQKSPFVRDVAPDAHAVTLREHQSFIELPGPGFLPRRYDPRAGYFNLVYRDYTAPLGDALDQQLIVRHRLVKKDPHCARACEAQHPLQYYVDRGAPEPIRAALVDGAAWWDEAFQAAGWAPGTFKVEVLPAGADPMDVRYNIIQWVHRYTRGWSYGGAVVDPRTGEIIKGNVTLGSLRGRQDYMIAEALLSPYVQGANIAAHDPMRDMVLARLRQLAAHETGHTLGLAHNFAASAFPHSPSQSVSVMDYPHPWITLDANGVPDVSQAYAVGIGQWDKVAIDYGYRQITAPPLSAGPPLAPAQSLPAQPPIAQPSAADTAVLDKILADAQSTGLVFITDPDARPLGSAHPHAHLFDNGGDPAAELDRIIAVRAAALTRFGVNAIRPGVPLSQLEDTLVPLYLLHRYQTDAAIKEIAGLDYRYQLRDDGQPGPVVVAPAEQRRALEAVLKTLTPEFLTLPEPLLRLFPPRPPGYERTRESFPSNTGLTFDPVAAAECAADLTLAGLFNPERAARLVEYHARDARNPSLLADVIDAVLAATSPSSRSGPAADNLAALVQRAVYSRTVESLLTLAADPTSSVEVRAIVDGKLHRIKEQADPKSAIALYLNERISQFERDPAKFAPAPRPDVPPGMPIGDADE